jgi:hypothetical protein
MDGINVFTSSLKEILQNMKISLNWTYTQHYTH